MTGQTVFLDFITPIGDSSYKLEGYLGGRDINSLGQIKIVIGDREYDLNSTHRVQRQELIHLDEPIEGSTFEVIVELPNSPAAIKFIGSHGTLPVKTNRFTGLSRLLFSSRKIGKYTFTLTRHLSSKPATEKNRYIREALILLSILVNWRIPDVYRRIKLTTKLESMNLSAELLKAPLIIAEAIINIPLSIAMRISYYVVKGRLNKPIWLISDRSMAAGDNGEAFFRYVVNKQDDSRDVFFVISRKSADYGRLRAIGPVVDHGSWRHKLLLLHAEVLASSQADVETINPYFRQQNHFIDLLSYDFVFLQHGIIKHDLSVWLNRFNRNISLFITSSQLEYQSILENNYYYTKEQVLLSGMPRYDLLENQPKQKIILAPTYRNNLAYKKPNKHGQRRYDPKFKKSKYFKFYNSLINEERILKVMKENYMTGELYIHPVFERQRSDFQGNSLFKVAEYPYDYNKAFREGSLLISDHSSVVFDFAYLKKPVLYAYFDADTFFDGQNYDKAEFFSDEKNGFGDVCYNYESLVEKMVALIRAGCKMPRKYQQRVDNYFYKTDRKNSERVYNAILSMNKKQAKKSGKTLGAKSSSIPLEEEGA